MIAISPMMIRMDPKPCRRCVYNEPGHAHELSFSCYRKYPFLKAERTCLWLSDAIQSVRTRLDFALWAFVFMPDHVHMVVCPRRADYEMASILRAMKEPVGRRAAWFLAKHASEWLSRIAQRRGQRIERHFWQPDGDAIGILSSRRCYKP